MTILVPGAYPVKPIVERPGRDHKFQGPRTILRATTYGDDRACTNCDRPLSRYNPDEICAPCHPLRKALP